MNILQTIDSITSDINNQAKRLSLYIEMGRIFAGVKFPEKVHVYFSQYSNGGTTYGEFSPGYEDDANKDLRPLVHSLVKRFHCRFEKTDNQGSISYTSRFVYDNRDFELVVSGVVPSTCRVEEVVIPLTDEEISVAKAKALENVKTSRVERKIICK